MSTKQIPTALPKQFRVMTIDAERKDGERISGPDPGRFRFAVSSEEPYQRWFGNEILHHGKDNVRADRLDAGVVPGLFNHDMDQQLGIVDEWEIKDGKLYVAGPFSRSEFAQEKRQDYDDGILRAASVGYRIHKMVRTEDEDSPNAPDQCDVVDWEPFDASLVTVPADITVGQGRSAQGGADTAEEFPVEIQTVLRRSEQAAARPVIEVQPQQEKRNMAETAEKTAAELELARRNDIMAVATDKDFRAHFTIDDAQRAIAENTSADAVKDMVIRKIISANDSARVGTLGDHTFAEADKKDQRSYSFVELLRSLVNQAKPGTFGGRHEASFEREMSAAIGKRLGMNTTGVFVPLNALTRALGTQTIAAGASQIATTSEAAAVETITRPEVI